MRRGSRVAVTVVALCATVFACAGTAQAHGVRAGAGAVDASWHVGASAGQYASDGSPVGEHGVDPGAHSTRRSPSYGMQSRLSARAIVVEGPDGRRVAIVKTDMYIAQDLLWRRAAQILEQGDSGIGKTNLTMAVSHNHSAPYYASPSWGVWAFQDVFDLRFYEYYAQRIARAVELAADRLEPVRVSAARTQSTETLRHSFGPAVADDGTPAGYPQTDTDNDMTVVRFDSRRRGGTVATLLNFGVHPEFLEGNDLISGDYVAPLERMVDRATGGVTLWTQNAVGTAEPERSQVHSFHERMEFSHRQYAQAERGARLMADDALVAWRNAGAGRGLSLGGDFPVAMADRWFPGPTSHPYPSVSNCRTDQIFAGNPQAPLVGLPDCQGTGQSAFAQVGVDPGITTDDFQRAGIPIPENYSAVSYTGLEEDLGVHLQAIRLGDMLIAVCSCEQWADQTRNVKTRTDREQGNVYLGYDWGARCTPVGDGTWSCPDPRDTSRRLAPVSDHEYQRMRAQVSNDAAGWNDPSYLPWAESEPYPPDQIKGNYTHTELGGQQGYAMTFSIAQANDYNGYIATYREYQRGDAYRKALTGWGPHSSDYMATRLVEMGGQLKGGAGPADEPLDPKNVADQAHQDARVTGLGALAGQYVPAYEATLPDDGGAAEIVSQPRDIRRFSAAFVTWIGGSNYTDDPAVVVERRTSRGWEDYADQSGEVPITVKYPQPGEVPAYALGQQRWRWTAHFEAFASDVADLGERPAATPVGTYRFVIRGRRRENRKVVRYGLASAPFEVRRWDGITVPDIRAGAAGVSFAVGPTSTYRLPTAQPTAGPRPVETKVAGAGSGDVVATVGPVDYPDSYKSPARFINSTRTAMRDHANPNDPAQFEWFCLDCSFRPWADTGRPSCAEVTVVSSSASTRRVPAREQGGRWVAPVALGAGEVALVAPGGVVDAFGQINATASDVVGSGTPAARQRAVVLSKRATRCR
jgi:hypothetical protein